MSTIKVTYPSGTSATPDKHSTRVAQTTADAKLHAVFEEDSGDSFDYFNLSKSTGEGVPPKDVREHLQRIQRGGLMQSFGCMLAVQASSFKVLAYTENAPEMLGLTTEEGGGLDGGEPQDVLGLGTDARNLFNSSSAAALEMAAGSLDASVFNPISVQCKSSGKPFFAIVHRSDVGVVFDLEPVMPDDPLLPASGPLESGHKLAGKAIAKLQSLPVGDIDLLCNTVVDEVRELTGYDRVMAYRFHEDEHGEVVAENVRSDLEPYLGLHYPATDIPQAARFLFLKNRVRMICDCNSPPVKIIQGTDLKQPLSLAGSTLRAPHGCHAQYMGNMGSIASLVMAVVIKASQVDYRARGFYQQKGKKLWGLVVCHHTKPRSVPYPLRSACEFLMEMFGLQLNVEVELATHMREKHLQRIQTILCDMLIRNPPSGIVTQSPNIMDLVKCDGAALYDGKKYWLLGTTPSESQIKDIVKWLLEAHEDSTGLSTDSLADAGYPGAEALGDAVCGIAAAKITSKDFLFWFRPHSAKEIKWGGAKHDPDEKDDGRKMHPRSSFDAFLEVVKRRSLPWEDVEIDAIHSLQLLLRDAFQDIDDKDAKTSIHARLSEFKMHGMDEISAVADEVSRLMESVNAPILAVDSNGVIRGWNAKVAALVGLPDTEAIGKSLVQDLVLDESVEDVERLLYLALHGEDEQNVEIKLRTFGVQKEKGPVVLLVDACSSRDGKGKVVGVSIVGQDVTEQKIMLDKFTRIQRDDKANVKSPNLIMPPIFGADEFGFCSEWNSAMEKLSGWKREDVVGKPLFGEIFGVKPKCKTCRLTGDDSATQLRIVLSNAMAGQESEKCPFAFFDRQQKCVETLLTATKRTDQQGSITGVFCFLLTASMELQQP